MDLLQPFESQLIELAQLTPAALPPLGGPHPGAPGREEAPPLGSPRVPGGKAISVPQSSSPVASSTHRNGHA
jgi:hypothetical protein